MHAFNLNFDPIDLIAKLLSCCRQLSSGELIQLCVNFEKLAKTKEDEPPNFEEIKTLIQKMNLPEEVSTVLLEVDFARLALFSSRALEVLKHIKGNQIQHHYVSNYAGRENRVFKRFEIYRQLQMEDSEKPENAILLNISRNGALIRSRKLLGNGEQVVIKLPALGRQRSKKVKATVIKSEEDALRIMFPRLLDENYIRMLAIPSN